MLRVQVTDNWILEIQNPKLLLLNVVITLVMLFLHACGLLPKWWYTLMYSLGGGLL